MAYKKNNNELKNDNIFTINLNDNFAALVDKLASFYNRKQAELLRLLITPVLIDEYAKMQLLTGEAKNDGLQAAIFKQ